MDTNPKQKIIKEIETKVLYHRLVKHYKRRGERILEYGKVMVLIPKAYVGKRVRVVVYESDKD